MTIESLRDSAAEALTLVDDLLDDPDCLAELEHTYSVFRFRYAWGTVYEATFSNLSDAQDRRACMGLIPEPRVYLETVDTDTLGIGHNGVSIEVTHRFVVEET